MNPLTEIFIITAREIKKNFRSVKGLILVNLSLLFGTGLAFVLVKIQEARMENIPPGVTAEQIAGVREQMIGKLWDPMVGKALRDVPEALASVLWFLILLGPLLVALMGFDAITNDLQYKTVRYWTSRSRRSSYYLAKVLGVWSAVSLITLLISSLAWVLIITRDLAPAGLTFSWGIRFWLVSLPITGAWTGIAMLIGSLYRVPIFALLSTMGAFFILYLCWLFGHTESLSFLTYAYPNTYDSWILSGQPNKALGGLAITLGMFLVTTVTGVALFERKDV